MNNTDTEWNLVTKRGVNDEEDSASVTADQTQQSDTTNQSQ